MTEVTQEKNRRGRKPKEAAPAAPAPAPETVHEVARTHGSKSHRHQLPNGLVVIYH